MSHVVVVGGGLTGLVVAYRLRQLATALTVTVLEPRDRPGGNIGTEEHDGFRVERGPNGFLDRTPRGRVATARAYEFFGLEAPGRDGRLW